MGHVRNVLNPTSDFDTAADFVMGLSSRNWKRRYRVLERPDHLGRLSRAHTRHQ